MFYSLIRELDDKGKPGVTQGPMHRIGCMAMNQVWFMGKAKGSYKEDSLAAETRAQELCLSFLG